MKLRALLATLVMLAAAAPAPPSGAADGGLQLADPSALRVELDRHRGRVVVLNLWATWCTPCLREIPDLMQLERELAGRGLVLVALGMDDPADFASVEAFRAKYFAGFRSLLRDAADMDAVVSVVDPAWNELLPTTYLIGRDGRLAKRIQGKRTLEQFRAEVEPLLRQADRARPRDRLLPPVTGNRQQQRAAGDHVVGAFACAYQHVP